MRPFEGVCLVTHSKGMDEEVFLDTIAKALEGGVRLVQLREKELSSREFLRRGEKVQALVAAYGVPLVINDRVDIALALKAQGVHLGQSDMPYEKAREILGEKAIIGLSVDGEQELLQTSHWKGVSYLGISAVFPSPTKEDTSHIWGLEGLRKSRTMTSLPLVAIGGITEGNASEVFRAGADMVAVVSAIMGSQDPKESARLLCRAKPC